MIGAVEHPSVAMGAAWLVQRGPLVGKPAIPASCSGGQACLVLQGTWEVAVLPVDHDGRVQLEALRRALDRRTVLVSRGVPNLRRNGHPTERLPNTLNVSFPDARGSAVLANAPDVAASTGSACHEGAETPSAVLGAMGVPPLLALGAVRLTLGRQTREQDVERAAAALIEGWGKANERL